MIVSPNQRTPPRVYFGGMGVLPQEGRAHVDVSGILARSLGTVRACVTS